MPLSDNSTQYEIAERFATLSRIGATLMSEVDEQKLLLLVAQNARSIIGATFVAFILCPVNDDGQPSLLTEGEPHFKLAAVLGVSPEQEGVLRQLSISDEGLLAPIFRYGDSVLIDDISSILALSLLSPSSPETNDNAARKKAFSYILGQSAAETLCALGFANSHPLIRSFLGAPLLNRDRSVIGGLLLGHSEPQRFFSEDESLLVGLAAQASVALENARLYRLTQQRAREMDAIFESITDGVILVDAKGAILRKNETAHALLQRLAHFERGPQAVDDLLHQPARLALAGKIQTNLLVSIIDDHQEVREYLVNASPLLPFALSANFLSSPMKSAYSIDFAAFALHGSSSSNSGAVIVWHDVTETRRLMVEREVLAETEARRRFLQILLDELPSSVYLVYGSDARLMLANRAARMLWRFDWAYGQSLREFIESHKITIFDVHGRSLPLEQFATLQAVQKGGDIFYQQETIRWSDGLSLPTLVNAVPLDPRTFDVRSLKTVSARSSEPLAIVVHQDVTALKETEQLKDEFIAIAAHELRTPLAIMRGFAQTLLVQTARGHGSPLADWQLEALASIDQSSQHMTELVAELLDVTRLQAGQLTFHPEPTDMVALVQRVLLRLRVTTNLHELVFHTPLAHLVIEMDPLRVEQVLNNLVNNAIKYSPQGGQIIITLAEQHSAQHVMLSIQDHGIGIPEQQQPHVFRRFERADNARAYGIAGTGLGLYLSRELVERQGGSIWLTSTEEQGSTFFVTLPLNSPLLQQNEKPDVIQR